MTDKTIQLLQQSLRADPSNWDLRVHVAELLMAVNDQEQIAALLPESIIPAEETTRLQAATLLRRADADLALRLCALVISANKANARCYRLMADIYRDRGLSDLARKNYNVAAVIDESLEDPEFESWLENKPVSENKPMSLPPKAPVAMAAHGDEVADDADEDCECFSDICETDAVTQALDSLDLIDFSHIGGMDALKERIRMSIIYPFKNKELFAKFKKRVGGGLLLYGPPGCGKTLISRATAGECGAHFINISIHEILSKWIGESEQRMHEIFAIARRKAPTIIFIDEIDALGVKRSDAGHSASLVNTLLTEIDGAASRNENVLVMGATNTPWRLDSAFRRPGRFDHVVFVPPPDQAARKSIFALALDGIPQESLDLDQLAQKSEKFSGADIRAVVEASTESVIETIMKSGKEVRLTQKELLQALKKHRPTTLEWLEQASNYASYANQSGLYDELSEYIRSI
jgi:ATP-dependent 26S proteasome regulatory subunit